jgi:ABC-type hemin transport system substrate-binding protein
VPTNKKAVLDRMLVQITDSIASINTHLNKCAEVLDTSDSGNKVIAQEAASIVSEVSKAERVRAKAVLLFGNLGEPGTYEMREPNSSK